MISYGGDKIRDEEITEVLGLIDQKILSDTIEAIAARDAGRCLEIVEQIYQFGTIFSTSARSFFSIFAISSS